jgi:hypothetical protein
MTYAEPVLRPLAFGARNRAIVTVAAQRVGRTKNVIGRVFRDVGRSSHSPFSKEATSHSLRAVADPDAGLAQAQTTAGTNPVLNATRRGVRHQDQAAKFYKCFSREMLHNLDGRIAIFHQARKTARCRCSAQ